MNKIVIFGLVVVLAVLGVFVALKMKNGLTYAPGSTNNTYNSTTNTYQSPTGASYATPAPTPTGTIDDQLKDLDSAANKAQSTDNETDPTVGL